MDGSSEWESSQPPLVAEPAPPPPESAAPESAAPPGELIPYHYRPQNEAPDPVVPRVLAEAFGGVLGGVGMGIVGLLAGASALEDFNCAADHAGLCAATVLLVAIPATFVGIPLGVQMAAESLGGRGEFLPSLAGTLLGTGAGLMYGLSAGGTGPVVTGLIVGPLLGAIVGYEISNALVRHGPLSASADGGPQVVPTVGATPRGGVFGGLSGRF
ncbi:MAG: hypothetical protein ACJ8AT_13125 [Hyalangium sp.]|uniref:hypothetical protein n=1 Tax=Hyalangium sp. TaxID=2028555 RepID=UPI0038999090